LNIGLQHGGGCLMSQRILIVDDHDGIRRRLRSLLEGAGFQVCGEAINGKQAVEKSKELRPDLVLLDLSMPVMTGLEALPQIAKLNTTKILVLTVVESDEMKRQVLRLGAHGYVGKSSLPNRLVAEVQRLLPTALVLTLILCA
jgi:DNA-binding NarL/FixJ family response regulator